jgi:thiosulfate/3-mercaptopyruvate sulfurtransferase
MLRRWLQWCAQLAFLIGCGLGLDPAAAQAVGPLVDARWLQSQLGRDDVLIIDASPPPLHAAAHIPGAVPVNVFVYGAQPRTPGEMQSILRSWGVVGGKRIVVYDQGGSFLATRVYFDLYHHGFPPERLHLLDGGLAQWRQHGGTVTKEATPAPVVGDFSATAQREEVRVRLPDFLNATGDPAHHAVVDALDAPSYYGETRFFDRAGHVPNAILMPADDLFNADKTFKSAAEIRRMAEHLGLRPEQRIHTYCGGGVAATVPFFALKFIAQYPQVAVYVESQLEWLRDERGLPMWTYATPNQLRPASWLAGWNSAQVRSFGVAQVSVIDLRTPERYREGHVPYSINLSPALFRQLRKDRAALARRLAEAGVDPRDEAVLVGDGRLDPDTALALVLLQAMGQHKASLLAVSLDEWALEGLPLTKQPTVVGRRIAADDLVVRAVSVAAQPRDGVVRSDGSNATVVLAGSKVAPTRAPAGTLVHLPYTDLLDEAGRPKAAGALWTMLSKAGVSRYASILCIADDPGEAAVLYTVLKLMGFARVTVQL